MRERWKPVVGYEGVYSVSSLGRVRRDGRARGARVGRILRASANVETGYLYVHLCVDGNEVPRTIHSLVAEAFLEPRPPGLEVSHRNGDPTDCRVRNLSWATHAENCQRSVVLGHNAVGRMQPNAKLSDQKVREIRALAGIVPQRVLAERYKVTPSLISDVIARKSWNHVAEVAS